MIISLSQDHPGTARLLRTMFWKYNITNTSHIDTLLKKEDVTLQELMDEEDILQECKAQSEALINFLVEPKILIEMVDLITKEPPSDVEEAVRYKYSNISAEILTSDVGAINNSLVQDEVILDKLFNFLDTTKPLNPLLASFFSKTLGMLMTRKTPEFFEFLKQKPDFVPAMIRHFNTSAIMDLMWRFVKGIDNPRLRQDIAQWLTDQQIIEQLVDLISPDKDVNYSDNATRILCDIVRTSREQMALMEEQASSYPLLLRLLDSQTITRLLDNMKRDKVEHAIVNGIAVLDAILGSESIPGTPDGCSQLPNGQLHTSPTSRTWDDSSIPHLDLQVLYDKALADFHAILLDPPQKSPIRTTVKVLDPPLGATRLEIVHLYHILLQCNHPLVNLELARLQSISTILDLFFRYPWNNFLHAQVTRCIGTILNNSPTVSADDQLSHPLLDQLFTSCHLVQRILDHWSPKLEEEGPDQDKFSPELGYKAHLTLIANYVAHNTKNADLIAQHINALPEDLPQKWAEFVSGPLAEINERNTIIEVKALSFQSAEAMPLQQLGLNKDDEQEAWGPCDSSRKRPPNQNILEMMDMFEFNSDANSHNAELFEQVCNDRTDRELDYTYTPRHPNWDEEEDAKNRDSSSSSGSDEEEPRKSSPPPAVSATEASTNPFKADLFNDSDWTTQLPSTNTTTTTTKDDWNSGWADFSQLKFQDESSSPWPGSTVSSTAEESTGAPVDTYLNRFHVRTIPNSHNPFRPQNASLLTDSSPAAAAASGGVGVATTTTVTTESSSPHPSGSSAAEKPSQQAPEQSQQPASNVGQDDGSSLIVKAAEVTLPTPGIQMEGGDAAAPLISLSSSSSSPPKENQQCILPPLSSSPL